LLAAAAPGSKKLVQFPSLTHRDLQVFTVGQAARRLEGGGSFREMDMGIARRSSVCRGGTARVCWGPGSHSR